MKHVTIRLADAEGVVLEERTVEGEFGSIEHYLATYHPVVTGAYSPDQLEAMLLEGLEGEATEMTDADWKELHRIATGEE